MATQTPNLNLTKPMGTDYVRIGDFNDNANALDTAIGNPAQLETAQKTNLVLAINEAAKSGGENAPYIDESTLHWMVWSVELLQYVDTGIKAEAKSGIHIGETEPTDESVNVWIDQSGGSVLYDPIEATDAMPRPVGVDEEGKLWAAGVTSAAELPVAPIVGLTAENTQEALEQLAARSPIRRYGIYWDSITAQGTRLWDAADITTDTTHFCHRGAVDENYNNPFDSLMPFAARRVCNINMANYIAMHTAGAGNLLDCVSAWEGDPDFKMDGSNGPVMVYTPEFWQYSEQVGAGQILGVADGPLPGWAHVPEHISGRWLGVDDGDGGLTSKPGIPIINAAVSTIHARAKAKKMTLDDIYTYSADTLLLCVEYATLNTQLAVGNGDDSSYRQSADRPALDETSVNRVILTDARAAYYRVNSMIDIGTTDGGYNVRRATITSKTAHSTGYTAINFDGAAVTISTAHYVSTHGIVNTEDAAIGSASGYLGENRYCHAYYRGAVAHAGRWQYILGAYRQQNTGHIWVAAPGDADNYDALNTSAHIDTGLVLPQGADGAAISGYIGEMHYFAPAPLAPFGKAVGGSSVNPVGDYVNAPTLVTTNTILRVGGAASYGTYAGRFCGSWNAPASYSNWYSAARPLLKAP